MTLHQWTYSKQYKYVQRLSFCDYLLFILLITVVFFHSESATFDVHMSPVAWGNLGNVLKNQGKMAEAEKAYRNALHHRGNMADMLYNLWVLKMPVPSLPVCKVPTQTSSDSSHPSPWDRSGRTRKGEGKKHNDREGDRQEELKEGKTKIDLIQKAGSKWDAEPHVSVV